MSNKAVLFLCALVLFIGISVWVTIFAFDASIRAGRPVVESSSAANVPSSVGTSTSKPLSVPSVISREEAKGMVSFDYKWGKSGLGMVMEVDFTFTNRSPYPAKDITVTCTHFAPSGTEIDSNTRTIYEIIPAKGKKTIRNFNMGFIHSQASSSSCKIDDLEM